MISIIVAVAENNAIGRAGDLLCHLSSDLKHFKAVTSGHTVIMGRKTFDSLPKGALPNRRNIVITRNSAFTAENVEVAHSLEEAINMAGEDMGSDKDIVAVFLYIVVMIIAFIFAILPLFLSKTYQLFISGVE